jgi:hypothetical protein
LHTADTAEQKIEAAFHVADDKTEEEEQRSREAECRRDALTHTQEAGGRRVRQRNK